MLNHPIIVLISGLLEKDHLKTGDLSKMAYMDVDYRSDV